MQLGHQASGARELTALPESRKRSCTAKPDNRRRTNTKNIDPMAEITVGSTLEKKFPGFGTYHGTIEAIDNEKCTVRWDNYDDERSTLTLAEAAKCVAVQLKRKAPPAKKKASPKPKAKKHMPRTTNSDPPQHFTVGLVLGRADPARDRYLARHFGHTRDLSAQTPWPDDEPVVSVLAKLETGDAKERAAKAAGRLGACGLSSVPSWVRPHKALSNGEAARVEVAARLARHASARHQFCVVDDFACVVNRDAARSMACAVGKYARRLRMTGLVLATAHDDVCAYLQPDWCYDVAEDTVYVRPTDRPVPPRVDFKCDWAWAGIPLARDRRRRRETGLVREVTNSYAIEPEAIERIVLGDGALPEAAVCHVKVDACARAASAAFDFELEGKCVFSPPDFPAAKLAGEWSLGVVHGPSGSGKTTVLRRIFNGVNEGKVATKAPAWDSTGVVHDIFLDKYGAEDAAARIDAAAVDASERPSRMDELTACGRARCQVAWLLASGCVLDEFTSLAARPLARRVARGVAAYVDQNNLQKVVCATVHEDVVAHLRPRWLFSTAFVTTCWRAAASFTPPSRRSGRRVDGVETHVASRPWKMSPVPRAGGPRTRKSSRTRATRGPGASSCCTPTGWRPRSRPRRRGPGSTRSSRRRPCGSSCSGAPTSTSTRSSATTTSRRASANRAGAGS